jgi:hypothetical protein
MYPTDFVNMGLTPSEFELRMMEAALSALTVWALATIAVASLVYFMLWLAETRRA